MYKNNLVNIQIIIIFLQKIFFRMYEALYIGTIAFVILGIIGYNAT